MKIVHVDDHTMFAEGIKAMLSLKTDYEVVSLSSVREALTLLDQSADIDLVMVDLKMPGMSGIAMLEAIEQRGIWVPVVVVSASEDLWEIRKAMNAGASGFIPKTAKVDEIIDVLNRVIIWGGGEGCLPDNIAAGIAKLPPEQPADPVKSLQAHYQVSDRQLDVLKLIQQGYSNDDIAQILSLSINTVKTHVRSLLSSYDVESRIKCVRAAEETGLLRNGD